MQYGCEAADQLSKPALPSLGRRTAAGHQPIGFLIPAAAWVVVAEHGRILLGLLDEAERQVALDEALQRFGDMRRRLVIVDDALETVYRRQILGTVQVIAADLHLERQLMRLPNFARPRYP